MEFEGKGDESAEAVAKDKAAPPSEPKVDESGKKSPQVLEPLVELGDEDDGDNPDDSEKNVISILPHDDPSLLDNDDSSNLMSDDHHLMPDVDDVEDLNEAGLFQVKEEMCEVKLEEVD